MRTRGTLIAPRAGFLAILLLGAASCTGARVTMPGAIETKAVDTRDVTLRVRVAGRVTTVLLERYVAAAALSEITPTGESAATVARIYDVQTILARSYALSHIKRHAREGFDLCDDTHCQVYQPARLETSQFAAAVRAATNRTRGRVLRSGPAVIDALFHADCGGHTTTPAAAWGGTNHTYLPARADDVEGARHRTWVFDATLAEWRTMLNADTRTAVGQVFTGLRVTRTGPGERVTAVQLDGTRPREVSGDVLRAVVSAARGARSVMSTRFVVERTDRGFRLNGSGFGHGVGLCQGGALTRARRGDSLDSILAHYFPGTRVAQ